MWNFFKSKNRFKVFEINYNNEQIFGVTAINSEEAEAMVCEQVFHNQTIPGIPTIKEVNIKEARKTYKGISTKTKRVWNLK